MQNDTASVCKVILSRTHQDASCTRGNITVAGKWICHTLELPWVDNKQNMSCIPAGVYRCDWKHGTKPRARVYGVTGRTGIQIHIGNNIRETSGCILVGMAWMGRDIIHSTLAMLELYQALRGAPFELEVVDVQVDTG